MAYDYSTTEIENMWSAATSVAALMDLHTKLDGANNAIGGCPIDATPYQ